MARKKRKNPERARGRPSDVEAGVLQSQLLDSAERLFAEHGYAATSVRRIAEDAGVNPSLVHYYYGSKRELLFAVMDRVLLPMAEAIAEMRDSGNARVERIVSLVIGMASDHPALPSLIAREVLLSGGETHEVFTREYAPRLGGALPGLLGREQAEGRLDPDFSPGSAALMLLSLCLFPFIARSLSEPHMGVNYDRKGIDDYIRQVRLMVGKGMKP